MALQTANAKVLVGDCLKVLDDLPRESVHCVVTSPPYFFLRDYGIDGQIGLEGSPQEYVQKLVTVFQKVKRVLRDDGTLWLNLGDCFSSPVKRTTRNDPDRPHSDGVRGSVVNRNCGYGITLRSSMPSKQLLGIPWKVAFALQEDGWYLRSDIIWSKPNPMPESVVDRPTRAHEYIFLMTKQPSYFYDSKGIEEDLKKDRGRICQWCHKPQPLDFECIYCGKIQELKVVSRPFSSPEGVQARALGGKSSGNEGKQTFWTDNGLRNKRSVWHVPVGRFEEAHFAVFPPKLILPCIQAGSSKKGCCPKCGTPWKRELEKVRQETRPGIKSKSYFGEGIQIGNRDPKRHATFKTTKGWKPGCGCKEAIHPIPCTVLDIFSGSGTTLYVAIKHHRNAIGIELNPEYAKMAEKRIRQGKHEMGFMAIV